MFKRIASVTDYGLLSSVLTKDMEKALRVASKIEAGTVNINKGYALDIDTAFGGWEASGLGRETGLYGLEAYLQEK